MIEDLRLQTLDFRGVVVNGLWTKRQNSTPEP